jgi:translation initiation factor IF-2
MSSIRIYELAKEKNVPSGDIIKICADLGIEVKSHSSTLTAEQKEAVLKILESSKKDGPAKAIEKKDKGSVKTEKRLKMS